jgi:hypothetical protein
VVVVVVEGGSGGDGSSLSLLRIPIVKYYK